uniref:Uncharacterized protein n=1 Tax=Romanomermis culicivorax TaxID=13658 RepID=A0A915K687_ROMCU
MEKPISFLVQRYVQAYNIIFLTPIREDSILHTFAAYITYSEVNITYINLKNGTTTAHSIQTSTMYIELYQNIVCYGFNRVLGLNLSNLVVPQFVIKFRDNTGRVLVKSKETETLLPGTSSNLKSKTLLTQESAPSVSLLMLNNVGDLPESLAPVKLDKLPLKGEQAPDEPSDGTPKKCKFHMGSPPDVLSNRIFLKPASDGRLAMLWSPEKKLIFIQLVVNLTVNLRKRVPANHVVHLNLETLERERYIVIPDDFDANLLLHAVHNL